MYVRGVSSRATCSMTDHARYSSDESHSNSTVIVSTRQHAADAEQHEEGVLSSRGAMADSMALTQRLIQLEREHTSALFIHSNGEEHA